MRRIIASVLLAIFVYPLIAQGNINLTNGSLINVVILNDVTTAGKGGTAATAQIMNDLFDRNGKVLIKAGTPVELNAETTPAKGVGKPGSINLKFISTKSVDGQFIKLNGGYSAVGEDRKGKALGVGLGVGLFLLFPMLAYMAKKGGAAHIPSNTIVTNIPVLGDYSVTPI